MFSVYLLKRCVFREDLNEEIDMEYLTDWGRLSQTVLPLCQTGSCNKRRPVTCVYMQINGILNLVYCYRYTAAVMTFVNAARGLGCCEDLRGLKQRLVVNCLLLAEWPVSFARHCAIESTHKYNSQHKQLTLKKETSSASPAGIWTRKRSITSPALYQQAIPAKY